MKNIIQTLDIKLRKVSQALSDFIQPTGFLQTGPQFRSGAKESPRPQGCIRNGISVATNYLQDTVGWNVNPI